MVSCNDRQALATQAAKARNVHDDSFGSLSMVVAGDFAQLPPMSGPSLYSGKVTLQAPPCTTNEFIPGKLSLCVGMPVMLRATDATEMCITKGQEGAVVGWDESVGPMGQKVLDTLFVKLIKPPKNVQIDDLPPNVVPLVRTVTHITVLMEDDTLLSVLREQIVALINFGMTDYTSQGKSRPINVAELANCKSHMSYYVALSRGTSAKGTVIVQSVNAAKITGGISGHLRQELRELEVLDEITRLRCAGLLPPSVTGLYRRRLIRSYYAWKSNHGDPAHFHPAMRLDPSLGPRVPDPVVYSDWRPSVPGTKKRKTTDSDPRNVKDEPNAKRKKIGGPQVPEGGNERRDGSLSPVGLVWDNRDHSYAYDTTLTILNNLWAEDTHMWTTRYSRLNDMMARYALNLNSVARNISTLEQARDIIRRIMHESNATDFPYGPNTTSIDRVASALFPEKTYGTGKQSCPKCGFNDPVEYNLFEAWMTASLSPTAGRQDPVPISNWMAKYLTRGRSSCPSCRSRRIRSKMVMVPRLNTLPPILLIDINNDRLGSAIRN
ncbi:hypothetical protein FB451DRAFT_1127073 [Mycena latifolia]|nr:hypothetical protein FB451DRAFT_1127073 [Mycena latifolia]